MPRTRKHKVQDLWFIDVKHRETSYQSWTTTTLFILDKRAAAADASPRRAIDRAAKFINRHRRMYPKAQITKTDYQGIIDE